MSNRDRKILKKDGGNNGRDKRNPRDSKEFLTRRSVYQGSEDRLDKESSKEEEIKIGPSVYQGTENRLDKASSNEEEMKTIPSVYQGTEDRLDKDSSNEEEIKTLPSVYQGTEDRLDKDSSNEEEIKTIPIIYQGTEERQVKDSSNEEEIKTRPNTTEDTKSKTSALSESSDSSDLSKMGLIGEIDYYPADENAGKCANCLRAIRDSQQKVRCDGDCRRSFHLSCTNLEPDDLEALSNPHLKWACSTSDCKLSGRAVARDIKAIDNTLDRLLIQMESIRTESMGIRSMLGDVFDNMRSIRRELAQMKRPEENESEQEAPFLI